MRVRPLSLPDSQGLATFSYVEEDTPSILPGYSPYMHYSTTGFNLTMSVTHLSHVPISGIAVLFSAGSHFSSHASPSSVTPAPLLGPGAVTIVVIPPPGPPGLVNMRIQGGGKASGPVSIKFVAPPLEPPTVISTSPKFAKVGDEVTITLAGFFKANAEQLEIVAAMGGQSWLLSGSLGQLSVPISTVDSTTISFPSPSFGSTGPVNITVYAIGRERLALNFRAYTFDQGFARVGYVFPEASSAQADALIEIHILQFGKIGSYAGLTFRASPPDGLTTASVVTYESFLDGSAVIKLLARRVGASAGQVRFEVANCISYMTCAEQTVYFDYTFRSPTQPFFRSATPSWAYSDGRVPLTLEVENLPSGSTTSTFAIVLGNSTETAVVTDVSPSKLDTGSGVLSTITAMIPPSSLPPSTFSARLLIPGFDPLTFPFSYLAPPTPTITAVSPSLGRTSDFTPLFVRIAHFPGVAHISDISVEFHLSDSTILHAQVTSFSRDAPSKPRLDIQHITVGIITPFFGGATPLPVGPLDIVVSHSAFDDRRAILVGGFELVDVALPRVSGMSTDNGDTVCFLLQIPCFPLSFTHLFSPFLSLSTPPSPPRYIFISTTKNGEQRPKQCEETDISSCVRGPTQCAFACPKVQRSRLQLNRQIFVSSMSLSVIQRARETMTSQTCCSSRL